MLGKLDKNLYYGMIMGAGMLNSNKFLLYANTSIKKRSYEPQARILQGNMRGIGVYYNKSSFQKNPDLPFGGGIIINKKKGLVVLSNGWDLRKIHHYYLGIALDGNRSELIADPMVLHDEAWTIKMTAALLLEDDFAYMGVRGLCTNKRCFDRDPEDLIYRDRNSIIDKVELFENNIKLITTYQGMALSSNLRQVPEREKLEDVIHSIDADENIQNGQELADWFAEKLNPELNIAIATALENNNSWDLGSYNKS